MTITLTLPQRDALIDLARFLRRMTRGGPPKPPSFQEAKHFGVFDTDDDILDILDYLNDWDQPAAIDTYWRNYHALTALEQIVGVAKVEVL